MYYEGRTKDDLHKKRVGTRSASRSKMRGARPRRARDVCSGRAARSEQAMDGSVSLIIDAMNILGEESGRFERGRVPQWFFEPPERRRGWAARK